MIVHLNMKNISVTREAAFEFFEESQLPSKLDYEYWMSRWSQIFEINMGTIIAYISDGELKGMMGALVVPCMMTGDLETTEAFWYVRKPYRGTPIGIKILKEFEKWSRDRGAKRAKMVHLEAINAEVLEKIYLRMGYSKLERAYSKELYEREQN